MTYTRPRYCLIFALFLSTCAFADTLVLPASRDNTLYEDTLGELSNGSGVYFFAGRVNNGSLRRGLIRFDLGVLPADSLITSAELRLHLSRTISADTQVRLHLCLADWGEGASNAGEPGGMGTSAEPGDATWLHTFFDTTSWAAAGGDFDPNFSGEFTANGVGSYAIPASTGMIADLQSWLDTPASNFGWVVIGDETVTSANRFDTRENLTPENRPSLEVTFTPPAGCIADLDDSGVVDAQDLALLLSAFENNAGGDLDNDLDTDAQDLALLLADWECGA